MVLLLKLGGYHYAQDSVNGFIENGESVKLRPLKAADGAYHTAALGPPSGAEQTDKLTAMLALAAGGTMVFDLLRRQLQGQIALFLMTIHSSKLAPRRHR